MGQLTVGILFFKSPRPTGWLGEIGVRHWPHRFPSCGLNQLWLLASLSLSFSLHHSLSPSSLARVSFSRCFLSLSLSTYAYIYASIFFPRSLAFLFHSLPPSSRASLSLSFPLFLPIPSRTRTTYTFYFIPFRRSHHAFNILGQRWLADTKLREYVTGPENPTEAAHSLFLYSTFSPPRALLIVAVISVAESFRGFNGRESRDKLSIGVVSVFEENDSSRANNEATVGRSDWF